jgi:hypothetical protein
MNKESLRDIALRMLQEDAPNRETATEAELHDITQKAAARLTEHVMANPEVLRGNINTTCHNEVRWLLKPLRRKFWKPPTGGRSNRI